MPAECYQLTYKKSVDKDLRKLPMNVRKQIIKKVQTLSINLRPIGSTKLRGSFDMYRIRHTEYRIIYQVNGIKLTVLVIKVGHRKEVYRDL